MDDHSPMAAASAGDELPPESDGRGISVIVAGGDQLFRQGLAGLFNGNGLHVIADVETLADADTVMHPSVVILIEPPRESPGWRQGLAKRWPDARAVALLTNGSDSDVVAALTAGADGCLFADISPQALVLSVRLVALGENLFPTRISQRFVQSQNLAANPALTPRERDILKGLVAGYSNKTIANGLGTTDMTVKAQLRHLLRKLGVSNRTQAAVWARENGMQ